MWMAEAHELVGAVCRASAAVLQFELSRAGLVWVAGGWVGG